MKKAIIITGNSFRHLKLVETVERYFDVLTVLSETKFDYRIAFESNETSSVVKKHFDARDFSEKEYFGDASPVSGIRSVPKGYVNDPGLVQELVELSADVIMLFGSSIIKSLLLEAYEDRVVNLHLGLSPYYRGSGTNFWPIVDGKPECLGATVHLAVPKVDAGPILHQIRPDNLAEIDSIHDLGNKTIRSIITIFPMVVDAYLNGIIQPQQQNNIINQEYRRMDLSSVHIEQANSNLKNGMLREYLANRFARNQKFPIISQIEN